MTRSLPQGVPAQRFSRLSRRKTKMVAEWERIGAQTRFYVTTLAAIPEAIIRYRPEILRLVAQMGLGSGGFGISTAITGGGK